MSPTILTPQSFAPNVSLSKKSKTTPVKLCYGFILPSHQWLVNPVRKFALIVASEKCGNEGIKTGTIDKVSFLILPHYTITTLHLCLAAIWSQTGCGSSLLSWWWKEETNMYISFTLFTFIPWYFFFHFLGWPWIGWVCLH